MQVNQRPHIARSGSNEHVTNLREPVAAEWAAQPDLLADLVGETPNQFVEVFARAVPQRPEIQQRHRDSIASRGVVLSDIAVHDQLAERFARGPGFNPAENRLVGPSCERHGDLRRDHEVHAVPKLVRGFHIAHGT